MDAHSLTRHITETYEGLRTFEYSGDTFFLYDPDGTLPDERFYSLTIATVVTGDHHDTVSDLDHPGAYRVNIGLPRNSYTARLGPAPTVRDEAGILDTGYDYAERDLVLPHPHYACPPVSRMSLPQVIVNFGPDS
ncbi:DUF6194 family protein [Halostreptopolyspora alba]|uniref:DUF6194 domain-containing protein n=1 Tax=Halostreptopolyspora alba TaxID=2487137 RepID=A0A3N0EFD2_9ACTN|nr:hypothetical protein EFW17_04555 [Nocardiopsaceae bacterium YIM 96095]